MKLKIIFFLMLNLFSFSSNADFEERFNFNKKIINSVLEAIFEINKAAINIQDHEMTAQKTSKEVLSRLSNPQEIYKMAILSHYIVSGSSKDVAFDAFYLQAFWASIMRLAEIKTQESLDALRKIAKETHIQGGDRTALYNIIENVEKSLK